MHRKNRIPFLTIIFAFITQPLTHAESLRESELINLLNSGKAAFNAGKLKTSKDIFEKVYRQSCDSSMLSEEISANRWLVKICEKEGQFGEAESICRNELTRLKRSANNNDYLVEEYVIFGYLECDQQKFNEANFYFNKSRKIADAGHCDTLYKVGPYLGLGQVLFSEKHYDEAAKMWGNALQIARSNRSDRKLRQSIPPCVKALVGVYQMQKKNSLIEELYKTYNSEFTDSDDLGENEIEVLANYAHWLAYNGKDLEALALFKRADELFSKYRVKSNAASVCHDSYVLLLDKTLPNIK